MYTDVDAFNKQLQADGLWVFGGGLEEPSIATVVRSENGGATPGKRIVNDPIQHSLSTTIATDCCVSRNASYDPQHPDTPTPTHLYGAARPCCTHYDRTDNAVHPLTCTVWHTRARRHELALRLLLGWWCERMATADPPHRGSLDRGSSCVLRSGPDPLSTKNSKPP